MMPRQSLLWSRCFQLLCQLSDHQMQEVLGWILDIHSDHWWLGWQWNYPIFTWKHYTHSLNMIICFGVLTLHMNVSTVRNHSTLGWWNRQGLCRILNYMYSKDAIRATAIILNYMCSKNAIRQGKHLHMFMLCYAMAQLPIFPSKPPWPEFVNFNNVGEQNMQVPQFLYFIYYIYLSVNISPHTTPYVIYLWRNALEKI